MEWTTSFLDALLERIRPVETAAGLVVNVVLTLLIVALGLAVARAVRARLIRAVSRTQATGNLAVLLGNVAFIGVVLLMAMLVLSVYGLNATALLAVLGAGTLAISLASQDLLKNLIAGAYLLLEHPFRVGDTIVVDNREGEVESIDLRVTVLRMADGTQALIPNVTVFTTTVLNRVAYPARRVSIKVAGLTEEMDTIEHRVQEALRDQPDLVPTPGPKVHVSAISEGKTTVVVDVWRKADRDLPPAVLLALRSAFPEADVSLV